MSARPTRPLVRLHGGKFAIGDWIIAHLPPHRFYVEPYGGGGSVVLRKPRSYAEVYNDLDEMLVGLFRVLRDDASAARLSRLLELTPFARDEFNAAYEPSDDPVENARRTLVRSFMGFGADGTFGVYRTGFRCNVTRSGTTPASDWAGYASALRLIVDRLRGVVIENRPALGLIERFDRPDALFYVDPPYLPATRSAGNNRRGQGFHVYAHELEDDDHVQLLAALRGVAGMVVLSGYPSTLYDDTLTGWRRVSRRAFADGGRERTEVLWINPAAASRLASPTLFD